MLDGSTESAMETRKEYINDQIGEIELPAHRLPVGMSPAAFAAKLGLRILQRGEKATHRVCAVIETGEGFFSHHLCEKVNAHLYEIVRVGELCGVKIDAADLADSAKVEALRASSSSHETLAQMLFAQSDRLTAKAKAKAIKAKRGDASPFEKAAEAARAKIVALSDAFKKD